MTKQELRAKNLKKRAQIKNKETADNKIRLQLCSQPFYKQAKTVMTYLSYKSEPDTLKLAAAMLAEGKKICAPVCFDSGLMDAFSFRSFSELKRSKMGILEPCQTSFVPPEQIELILVPGCAFNGDGYRIGYGGGFYDRFLPKCSAVTCGLFYERLKTDFHQEKTDIPLHFIITEEAVYKFLQNT